MGKFLDIMANKEPDFMIKELYEFELFGQTLHLTTTHISIFIVCEPETCINLSFGLMYI